ncbi:hypothetical protein F6J84_06530 [Microbacterium caowuchunii]|uniref:universal stress protein n=1 Tax=Microbacterium caowuchunii TaxID=2614638 RepID=UPI001246E7C7|nr:universal stress protein [Microbacterium caowuchunii]QEW01471.1 hypothetical protein F6J84_06530 [Microbacterium caowuchunii]
MCAQFSPDAVVSSRGRGGFAGLLWGSGQCSVCRHGPCPVLVVHAGPSGIEA